MANLDGQLDGIRNHLGDISLGMSIKMFPGGISRGVRTRFECGWQYPMGWDLELSLKEEVS